MKKSGVIAASVAAASASASALSSSSKSHFARQDDCPMKAGANSASQGSSSSDKFAPRFDGLRFIETLVTAHR